MSQTILGFNAQKLVGAANFNYRGYNISFSNIMNNAYFEVLVTHPNGRGTSEVSVESAIEFVNALTD